MLVTFEDSQSALRVMDIDGVKVRPPQTYHRNFLPDFSEVIT